MLNSINLLNRVELANMVMPNGIAAELGVAKGEFLEQLLLAGPQISPEILAWLNSETAGDTELWDVLTKYLC